MDQRNLELRALAANLLAVGRLEVHELKPPGDNVALVVQGLGTETGFSLYDPLKKAIRSLGVSVVEFSYAGVYFKYYGRDTILDSQADRQSPHLEQFLRL